MIYDEQSGTSVADHIISSVQNILTYFDISLYRKIIEEVATCIHQGTPPDHSWFISHPDEEIRQFAVNVLSTPYVYASWEKKEMFLQTQKMPDENYVRDAENALLRLQLRKSKRVIKELQAYFDQATADEKNAEEYIINLKVMQVLLQERNDIAAKLGTVTL
ncbi:MAG: hypothetical protein IPP49_14710 [Saprospiraceae bacterium]|nr:hypothetical protein [Saprospiraceae bacterium]